MLYNRKDPIWTDEAGVGIPRNRLSPLEKLKEKEAVKILKQATDLNNRLLSFKTYLKTVCDEVLEMAIEELKAKKDIKGNFTWYSFDRSLKVETSINEQIKFDDITINAAQEELNLFLNANISSEVEYVKDLITDAFAKKKGSLDTKKVLGMLKYKTKIKDSHFQRALELIEQAIRRPSSKRYTKIYLKDEAGEYQAIELNFSNV